MSPPARPFDRSLAVAAIDVALADDSSVPPNTDARMVEASLRAHICDPFEVRATVMAPAFPFAEIGATLSGFCIARREGHWLVYQPDERRFLCFWGQTSSNLGAHGVYGNPLYCWSA